MRTSPSFARATSGSLRCSGGPDPRVSGARSGRNSLDRLVQRSHRTTERVAGSVEELADAAAVRIKKARIERMRTRKRTELGKRVHELANEQTRFAGRPPEVLDDDQVKALLQDLGSLDADLRNAASKSLEPDRIEA